MRQEKDSDNSDDNTQQRSLLHVTITVDNIFVLKGRSLPCQPLSEIFALVFFLLMVYTCDC